MGKKEKEAWTKIAHFAIDIRLEAREIKNKEIKEKVDKAMLLIAEAIEQQFPTAQ